MPTFHDPSADAGEASEALRGLAHASRAFEHPQDMYSVLGDLLSGVRSLRQVLDQLATAHSPNRARAFDDHGGHAAGSYEALNAAAALHQAATFIDQTEDRLNVAMSASGTIAWHTEAAKEPVEVRRWIEVVFLQGEEADEALNMIDQDGPDSALGYLKNWDCGDETTDAAMENGDVYDVPPARRLEHEVRDGDYQMSYSHSFAQVALYRLHTISSEDVLIDDPTAPVEAIPQLSRSQRTLASRWFEHPDVAAVKQARGIAL